MDGFCVKCKLNRGIANPIQVPLISEGDIVNLDSPKATARYKGICPVCGTVIYRVERQSKIIIL